jgi:hypothetical protein
MYATYDQPKSEPEKGAAWELGSITFSPLQILILRAIKRLFEFVSAIAITS